MRQLRSRLVLLTLVAALVAGVGLTLLEAQVTDETLIQYRQKLMSAHGASMGSIGDMMKFQLDYGPQHIEIHARNISEYAKLIPEVFEKEIAAGATDAKPEIWQNWDDFLSKAKTLETEAGKLAAAAAGGNVAMPAVMATQNACRGCHENYRKPKEESYKNQ